MLRALATTRLVLRGCVRWGLTRRVVAVRVDARDLHLAHVDTRRLRNALAERQEHSCRLRVCEDTRADQQQYPRPAAPLAL